MILNSQIQQEIVTDRHSMESKSDSIVADENGTCNFDEDDDTHKVNSSTHNHNSDHIDVNIDGDADSSNNHPIAPETHNSEVVPPPTAASPATRSPNSSKKGYGLKKWRRIRRKDHVTPDRDSEFDSELQKEKDCDSDSTTRMLKRGPLNVLNQLEFSPTATTTTAAAAAAPAAFVVPFPLPTTYNNGLAGVDSDAAIAVAFNAGADSDNSEDSHGHGHSYRSSSKSSTAASAPKHAVRASGQAHHSRDKHKVKNSTAKNSNQRFQSAKNQAQPDPSKKHRGVGNVGLFNELERERERESSPLSSMESDSRSSNSVLFRGSCDQLPTSNPTFHGDDACNSLPQSPRCEQQLAQQRLSLDSSDQLSSSANQVKNKDHQLPGDGDPLAESILMLQSAQLALQKEVQKFGEIGKGICSLCDDSEKASGVPIPSMSVDPVDKMDRGSDGWSEFTHAYLSKIVQTLERQLNDAEGSLKERDLKIAELEMTMRSKESSDNHARTAMEKQYKICIEMEAELQHVFKQKLEAEIQFVVITRFTKDVMVEDQTKFLRENESVSRDQAHSPQMMVDVENKATTQQEQAEISDALYTGVVGGEELLKMQRGVVKFTKFLIIQLVLLVLMFALFILPLLPKSVVVIPT